MRRFRGNVTRTIVVGTGGRGPLLFNQSLCFDWGSSSRLVERRMGGIELVGAVIACSF